MVDETVLDRLAKLIELQARPGSVAEAEAAAARIQSILTRHQLTLLDAKSFLAGRPGNTAGFTTEEVTLSSYTIWREMLLNGLAKQNFCRAIRMYEATAVHKTNKDGWRLGSTYTLVGRAENIAAVVRLFDYLEATIDRLGKEYVSALGAKYSAAYRAAGIRFNPKAAGTDFRNGAVIGVCSKLLRSREAEVASGDSRALVVVEESKLDEAVKANLGEMEKGKRLALDRDSAAFRHGVAAGFGIGTDAQLTQGGTSGTLSAGSGTKEKVR